MQPPRKEQTDQSGKGNTCDETASPFSEQKRLLGQFFTITNPFDYDLFHKWWKQASRTLPTDETILEPFAGANNILRLAQEVGIRNRWACYDIAPPELMTVDCKVEQRDTLKNFPVGHRVAITNPPYLAKNSATRRGLEFPDTHFEDIYQVALEKMLTSCDFVAAIIPASFLTQHIMQDRLFGVIALNCKMFDDTECPVCLSLFVPETSRDFPVYRGNEPLGMFHELEGKLPEPRQPIPWRFNDPAGEIGLKAIDNTRTASIEFVAGDAIPGSKVVATSRSLTRIKVPGGMGQRQILEVIRRANQILTSYRKQTHDVLMTTFKGLRDDGDYRRRLDFTQARKILNLATS